MTDMRRVVSVASLAAAAFLAGCDDGLIRPPAPAAPAAVAIAASLDFNLGGLNEAYLKVNQLSLRFLAGSEVRLAQTVPFNPTASETVVSLEVPLKAAVESFTVQLDLLSTNQKLFTGTGTAELSSGSAKEVQIPILPVVSGINCAGTPFPIRVYQAARRITAAALFASGDTVPGVAVSWSTSNASIVTVNQAGDLMGLQDGTAQVTCSVQTFSSTRQVDVLAAVATVQVTPALDTVNVGTSAPFTAAFKDSLAHPITTPRATTWSSSSQSIATINTAGLATGVAPGTATISATSGGAIGTATLLVLSLPVVTTLAATGVDSAAATLNGSVNPQGLATQGWFRWSLNPDLSGAQETARQQVGSGNVVQAISQRVSGVANQTYYYRALASSAGGTAQGDIASFTTRSTPGIRTISGIPQLSGAALQGEIDPLGLFAQAWFQWGTDPTFARADSTPKQNFAAGRGFVPTSGSLVNLTGGVTYYFRAVARNNVGTRYGQSMSFVANGPPVVTTLAASAAGTSATLNGTVNPNGTATSVRFEWGTSPSLAGATFTAAQNIGAGTSAVAVQAGVSGLEGGATYYFRVTATNQVGTSNGSILSFTLPRAPSVTTLSPTGITTVAATLQASVNPNGAASTAWFEWGVGAQPFSFTPTSPAQSLPAGSTASSVSFTLGGLVSGRTYSYRAVANNAQGTTTGNLVTFTTAGPPSAQYTNLTYVDVPGTVAVGYYAMHGYGTATPNGAATQAWFEYANDPFATTWGATAHVNVGSGFSPVAYDRTWTFTPDYCYTFYFRVVAENTYGRTTGPILAWNCESGVYLWVP